MTRETTEKFHNGAEVELFTYYHRGFLILSSLLISLVLVFPASDNGGFCRFYSVFISADCSAAVF